MADSFSEILEGYPPDIITISGLLHATIKNSAPDAVETFNLEQKHLGFAPKTAPEKEIFLLAPKKSFVLLVFKNSKRLMDVDGLLGSEGKETRFMTLRTSEEVNNPALGRLIAAAWNNAVETAGR